MRRIVVAAVLLAATGSAAAQVGTVPVRDGAKKDAITMPSLLSYSFADLAYGQTRYDDEDGDVKADGFGLSGSFLLPTTSFTQFAAQALYVTAGYSQAETDEINGETLEITDMRVGLGYRMGLSSALDLTGELDFLQQDLEFGNASDDDTGYRLGLGARFQVAPQIEVGGGVRYVDTELAEALNSETVLEANGLYHIMKGFSTFLTLSYTSESTGFGAGARYNFGF